MSQEADTIQLLRLAMDGQRDAFEQLVKLHERKCFALAFRIVGEYNAALDVCQDSFVQAFRQLAKLKKPSRFEAWLARIVINRGRSYLRQNRARAKALADAPRIKSADKGSDGISWEVREALDEAVRELPDRYRTVFVLYTLNGFNHAQIAEILNKPVKTVRWRLHQARKLLRAKLDKHL